MPADYAALEAARLARGGRDSTERPTFVERVAPRERNVAGNGLTFSFGRKAYAGGRGIGAMSPERRREISRKANAARWAK